MRQQSGQDSLITLIIKAPRLPQFTQHLRQIIGSFHLIKSFRNDPVFIDQVRRPDDTHRNLPVNLPADQKAAKTKHG